MTFTDIEQLIQNPSVTGPTVGICNCINALATAARSKNGNIEGIIGSAVDENETEELVYFNSLDPSFLVILGIASIMGIQIHNNLKTDNPALWQELYTLINSKYFKTIIELPAELSKTILDNIESKASIGAPAFITADGELYVSGDLMEAVFQSLQNAGAFNTGEVRYDVVEMPTAIDDLDGGGYIIGTWAEFMEYMDSQWSTIKAFNNAHTGRNYSERGYYDYREFINAAGSFTEYWANMKALFSNDSTAMEYMTRAETGTRLIYGYEVGACKDNQQSSWPYGHLLIYAVYKNFNRFLVDEHPAVTPPYVAMETDRREMIAYSEVFGFSKYYSWNGRVWSNYNACRSNISSIGGYSRIGIYDTYGQPSDSALGQNTYATGAWFIYTGKSSGGDTPPGLNQEEGAVLPSSTDNSFTAWAASNLSTYYSDRLITGAPATANIPAHMQNWFKINIPYSLGYNADLDGLTEEGDNGKVTQQDSTTISQKEENEQAGKEDTGTNTDTIINIYNAEEGSEPDTKEQEDSGQIELEDLPTDDWNAAGMTGIYAPTPAQLKSIETWLWSLDFLDNVNKFFQDPAEALIGLYKTYMPFSTMGSQEVVFGRVGSGISAGVTNRYHEYSLGSIHVERTFNNYMDYTGNASIYVPFSGFQSVDLKDIMEADIELIYRVEFLTGAGVAILMVTRDEMSAPLYVWPVNVFESIPVSSYNAMGTYTAGLNALSNAVSGGVSGAVAGGPAGAVAGVASSAIGAVGSLAQSSHVNQGGSLAGNGAFQGPKKGYLTIRYNKNASPAYYEQFEGIGTDTISTIGAFRGYVKFREVYLQGIPADSAVIEEIESALKEGVYV